MSQLNKLFSDDNFSPHNLNGLKLWLDASDEATITQSSGAVSQWNDKSGNDNHATQSTGSAQPTTGTNTQNNKNILDFDGTDTLQLPSGVYSVPNDASTIFIVSKCTDTSVQRRVFVMTDGSTARYKMAYETKTGSASASEVVFQVDSNLDPLGAQSSGTSSNMQILSGTRNGATTTLAIIMGHILQMRTPLVLPRQIATLPHKMEALCFWLALLVK